MDRLSASSWGVFDSLGALMLSRGGGLGVIRVVGMLGVAAVTRVTRVPGMTRVGARIPVVSSSASNRVAAAVMRRRVVGTHRRRGRSRNGADRIGRRHAWDPHRRDVHDGEEPGH